MVLVRIRKKDKRSKPISVLNYKGELHSLHTPSEEGVYVADFHLKGEYCKEFYSDKVYFSRVVHQPE